MSSDDEKYTSERYAGYLVPGSTYENPIKAMEDHPNFTTYHPRADSLLDELLDELFLEEVANSLPEQLSKSLIKKPTN